MPEPMPEPLPVPVAVPAGVLLAGSTSAVEVPADAAARLTPTERARATALMRARDRADYIAAHLLVRRCAALLLGTEPERLTLRQDCPGCGRAGHGRPSLAEAPQVRVSLAHTAGYVAAVAGMGDVGVDVERVPAPERVAELAGSVLSPTEQAVVRGSADPSTTFARLWVRKEAVVKLGLATLDTLPDTDVSAALADTASWQGYAVLGWSGPAGRVVGAVVARQAPDLVRLLD